MQDRAGRQEFIDALDVLEEEGAHTLRVAVDSSEAPEALIERADVVVRGPAGAVELLRRLLPNRRD